MYLWTILTVLVTVRTLGLLAQHSAVLAIILSLTIGLIPGVGRLLAISDQDSFRYLVTATVNADGETYTGSAVQEITVAATVPTIPQSGGYGVGVTGLGHGEAVVVDIPGRPSLYFLAYGIRGRWAEQMLASCKINDHDPNPVTRLDVVRNFRGPCVIPPKFQPTAVRFANETDPTTIELVRPPETAGVDGDLQIVEVTVQRTDKPLDYSILKRLPWLTIPRRPAPRLKSWNELTIGQAYAYGFP